MPMSGRIPVFVGICGQSCMSRGRNRGRPGWPGCRNPQRSSKVTSARPAADQRPRRHRTTVPSASRASARPQRGSPHSVACSGASPSPRPERTRLGGVGDDDRARADPHRDRVQRRRRRAPRARRARARPTTPRSSRPAAATRRARARPPRRPARPTARARTRRRRRPPSRRGSSSEARAQDRRPAARRAGRRGAQVGVEHLVQQHVAAVELERLAVVGPRLLLEPAVGLHERREGSRAGPSAAAAPSGSARPGGSRGSRRRRATSSRSRCRRPRCVAATSVRSDQKSEAWSPAHSTPVGLLAAPAAAPEEHAAPGAVRLVERALHRAPVQAAVAPRGLRARRAVGEAQVLAHVVALAVVGLDALHAERAARARPARATTPRSRGR